jgi:hypothetical protein
MERRHQRRGVGSLVKSDWAAGKTRCSRNLWHLAVRLASDEEALPYSSALATTTAVDHR